MSKLWRRATHIGLFPFLLLLLTSPARALTLEQALEETLLHNPEILTAKDRIQQAIGYRTELRSVIMPRFGVDVAAGVAATTGGLLANRGPELSLTETRPTNFALAHARLVQSVFDARIPVAWARGDVGVLMAQQEVHVRANAAMHRTRITFYQAQFQRELAALLAESKTSLLANLKNEEERKAAGISSRAEVVRAELVVRAVDPFLLNAKGAYRQAQIALARAMGRPLGPDDTLPVPDGELKFQTADFDLATETAAALERRPDLRFLRETIRSLKLEKRAMQARYLPVVTFAAKEQGIPVGGISGTSASESVTSKREITTEYEFIEQFTWQVIDNGEITGAVRREQKQYEIGQVLLEKLEQQVPRDLMRIQQEFQSIEARRKAHRAILADAEKSVELVGATIKAGAATQLDYRNAQRALIEVRVGILQTAFQQSIAIAEWDQAAGRYLQFSVQSDER
jgi:outer membrane protein TolC